MKKRRYWIISVLCLVLGIYLYSHYVAVPAEKLSTKGIPVTLATASKKDVVITAEAIGQVLPFATVSISSQVDGQLEKIAFQEGQLVKQGQLLLQIDPRPFQAKLAQAQGVLANDKAQLWNAKLILARYAPLEKKGYLAKQDYDQAKASEEALQATVQADQAAVAQAQLQVDYCTITAPITGRTGNLLVNAGNLVTANSTVLVTINQLQPIYVSFSLPEKQLPLIRKAQQQNPIMVTVVTANHQSLKGKLSFINNTVDNATGTIQLKAIFANPDDILWPGQFVQVSLPLLRFAQALVVPVTAVQQGQQGPYVYVLKNNSTVAYQPVVASVQSKEGVIITQGLQAGDKVVTAGQLRLTDGSKVSVPATP